MRLKTLTLSACFAGSLPAQNNLPPDAIPPPDPEAQMATFVLDDKLEINLFAADPMIAKPVAMNWDAQGRLWVVSSRLYPHIKPGERSDDQVVVLEDTNGDGAADKSSVFADDLLIPTGVQPADGGAFVANSTELLFIKDTDGDLREDERSVVLSGFGTEDTHHIIHAFRCGPEAMLYFNQSIYIHSHIETPHGHRRLMAGGIWHFRPETAELEVFARGFINTWGHAWDRYGQSFATDGAFGEGINYVFPGATFKTAYNAKRELRGLNPGQPKHCGLEVVNSSHFPEEWQGNMITNDFRGHRVNRFVVTESGSGYVSRQAPDLIRTTHGAFRPIDVKVGPDGALYIADWYNPIIQHGEVDFRDPRRDHTHGRIWRVTYKDRPLVETPDLAGQSADAVAAQLASADGLTRQFAKQTLRGLDAGQAKAAVSAFASGEGRSPEDKLEALWAAQALNVLDDALLRELLACSDHRVRAAAVRVLYHWQARVDDAAVLLGRAVADEHPRVRLEAVNALRQVGGQDGFVVAMRAFGKPVDSNLDFALWLTARELESDWLPALERGELEVAPAALQFALTAIERPDAIRYLHARFTAAVESEGDVTALADLFTEVGNGESLALVYDYAIEREDDAMLARLYKAQAERGAKPKVLHPQKLVQLVRRGLPHAILLAGAWKVEPAKVYVLKRLNDRGDNPEECIAALSEFGDEESVAMLEFVAKGKRPTLISAAAVVGLVKIDEASGAQTAIGWLQKADNAPGVDRVLGAFLSRKGGADRLAKALDGAELPAGIATAAARVVGASGGDTASLIAALSKAGGLEPLARALGEAEMAALVAQVHEQGDARRGELVYRRAALICQTCHAIGGGGGVIGPDLVSIGASAPVDYIVDSLLEPAKKIKEGYHTTVVTTRDGTVMTGGLVRKTDSEVVLRLADGSEKSVPVATISKKEIVPVSLMPAGLTASLRKDELVDLVKFLSELGKEGDYKVPPGRIVRRWRVLPYDDAVSNQIRRVGTGAMLGSDTAWPWRPAYSTVSGLLPLSEMGVNKGFSNDLSFAKFEIDVTAAGEIGFEVADPRGLQILLGGAMLDVAEVATAELPVGRHTAVVLVDRAVRSEGGLRVELVDVAGATGRASLVGGL